MKVKCIDNWKGGYLITIGKMYDVIEVDNYNDYKIANDIGHELWYEKELFKPAISEMRNDKIDKLLSDES